MIEIGVSVLALTPGRIFHRRYEVVRCIKAGGMGAIYEVIHLETRRRRALKLMLPSVLGSVELRARFELEATVAADIESEHIVEVFDAGVDAETDAPFLVMELLRGEDLATMVERRGKLPPRDVVLLLAQVASALERTHAAAVVHRDLKPDNLFVTKRDDGAPKIKILDFGIAKVVAEGGGPAAKTRVLGTPIYMSPEQVRGDGRIGPRADLHALAHIAFTLLVGKAYWAEENEALPLYALMKKLVGGCQVPAAERAAHYGGAVSPAFGAWFERATRVVPEERFASATAMVEALAEALDVDLPAPEELASSGRDAGADTSVRGPADRGVDTVVSPDATLPAATLRTETEAPAALAAAESPRKGSSLTRVAGVAAAAAIVLVGVALTAHQPRDEAAPAALNAAAPVVVGPRTAAIAATEAPASEGTGHALPPVPSATATATATTTASERTGDALPPSATLSGTAPVVSAKPAPSARPPSKAPPAASSSPADSRPKRSID